MRTGESQTLERNVQHIDMVGSPTNEVTPWTIRIEQLSSAVSRCRLHGEKKKQHPLKRHKEVLSFSPRILVFSHYPKQAAVIATHFEGRMPAGSRWSPYSSPKQALPALFPLPTFKTSVHVVRITPCIVKRTCKTLFFPQSIFHRIMSGFALFSILRGTWLSCGSAFGFGRA